MTTDDEATTPAGDGPGAATATGREGALEAVDSTCACSACHCARVGLRASTAQASRWRSVATWLSQQATEQNTSRVRFRLQVDTLQTQ
ncbi:MAG: hypothetical protein IPI49_02070 [Myxococcales bacterium]|nr:hypothetical protein [Myxococcales bacterium]